MDLPRLNKVVVTHGGIKSEAVGIVGAVQEVDEASDELWVVVVKG
jgi:hypothetical protein